MPRKSLKGIKQVVEGSFSAETGYIYFVRNETNSGKTDGYILFNGKKYGTAKDAPYVAYNEIQDLTQQEKQNVFDSLGVNPLVIYSGSETPPSSLGNNGDLYLQTAEALRAPDTIYETDGTTGLLGHNQSSFANQWQLENLDLTPYKYIKCYFKCAATGDSNSYTTAVVVTVPLDTASMGPSAYMGSTMAPLPFNRNREYLVSCAVDSTKTKFQVVHQNTLWDISTSDANNTGRYCYKIEGWY